MRINTKRGIAPLAIIIIVLLVLGGAGYALKKSAGNKKAEGNEKEQPSVQTGMPVPGTDTKEKEVIKEPTTLQIKLTEQNASGQGGQAVIVPIGTSTLRVIVNLAGKPSSEAEPAHIHLGSCPNPGVVKYPLVNVGKGASQTDISNMTIEKLLSELPLAINVHKSATDIKTYVACGNITAETVMDAMKKEPGESMKMQKETRVSYTAQGFSPKTIAIKKGEAVVFENKTGKPASVASNVHPTHLLYPEFDQYKTDQREKNEFRFTFTKVGTWNYHDHLNAGNGGTVIVTE